jgi:hypothetical protein
MTIKTSIISKIAPLAATAVLLAGFATGAAAQTGFKAPTGPQAGDCKRIAENAIGQNPAMAQQVWVASVAGKFGSSWAQWPAAQASGVVFVGQGQYLATGKPCYIHQAG